MLNRKLFLLILFAGIIVFSSNVKGQQQTKGQEWKSIKILRTTRSEVEKQFGEPTDDREFKFQSLYEQKDYNLLVYYNKGCTDSTDVDNYDVPAETVKNLIVYLKEPMSLSAFNIDIKNLDTTKFEKYWGHQSASLEEIDEGITYRLSAASDEASVISISYRPKKKEQIKLCKERVTTIKCPINARFWHFSNELQKPAQSSIKTVPKLIPKSKFHNLRPF